MSAFCLTKENEWRKRNLQPPAIETHLASRRNPDTKVDLGLAGSYYSGGTAPTWINLVAGPAFALTYASSIAINLYSGNNFTVTLTGNATLANPTNGIVGSTYRLQATQDGTGSRTLAFGSQYKTPTGGLTIDSAANSVSVLSIYYRSAGVYEVALVNQFAS
jgi:hypothetical protein